MTQPSPADTLRAAAQTLRGPDGTITVTIPAAAADAMADWLDSTASHLDAYTHPEWQETVAPHPLAVARAILQEQP
ncbi:hypothetical protein [Streptomyces sp. NPDC051079]|uniref:hypothetical protein n=1 Tax=unclassified Streptomyces TaxID=2593676 RepID=UPI00344EF8FE